MQSVDESVVPFTINCWPSVSGNETYVSIEYEATSTFDLQNVVVSVPLPALREAPNVRQIHGEWRYDSRNSILEWSILLIDNSLILIVNQMLKNLGHLMWRKRDQLVERSFAARTPTMWGPFTAYCYQSIIDGIEHIVMVKVNYGNFMHGLMKENIQLNRKILSELSMHEPYSFKAIWLMSHALPSLETRKLYHLQRKKAFQFLFDTFVMHLTNNVQLILNVIQASTVVEVQTKAGTSRNISTPSKLGMEMCEIQNLLSPLYSLLEDAHLVAKDLKSALSIIDQMIRCVHSYCLDPFMLSWTCIHCKDLQMLYHHMR